MNYTIPSQDNSRWFSVGLSDKAGGKSCSDAFPPDLLRVSVRDRQLLRWTAGR